MVAMADFDTQLLHWLIITAGVVVPIALVIIAIAWM